MIYVSKELPNLFRDRMWTALTQGIMNRSKYNANVNTFRINFYEGTIPEDISTTYTMTPASGTSSVTTAVATSNIPNTLLATITDTSFIDLQVDGDNWISVQLPFAINKVANGTIGFYEFLLNGKGSTYTATSAGSTYNDWYNLHPKSAFYGSVGLLSSGAEIILDTLTITDTVTPNLYELGFNPQITV